MGMFDTILFDKKIIKDFDLRFTCCNGKVKSSDDFQTKDLESVMMQYYLRYNENKLPQLYLLGDPDKKHWHEYSLTEMKKFSKPHATMMNITRNSGYFLEKAWLPVNRSQSPQNDIHQYIDVYDFCDKCIKVENNFLELRLKFTDGVMTELKIKKDLK